MGGAWTYFPFGDGDSPINEDRPDHSRAGEPPDEGECPSYCVRF